MRCTWQQLQVLPRARKLITFQRWTSGRCQPQLEDDSATYSAAGHAIGSAQIAVIGTGVTRLLVSGTATNRMTVSFVSSSTGKQASSQTGRRRDRREQVSTCDKCAYDVTFSGASTERRRHGQAKTRHWGGLLLFLLTADKRCESNRSKVAEF